jgi:hypothetical protein
VIVETALQESVSVAPMTLRHLVRGMLVILAQANGGSDTVDNLRLMYSVQPRDGNREHE